ncbi:hypothetical protein [Nocardioides jensenii]|uniref:hypothetical protein n=1 Tax=Nocardioides jensenii TaxID=1843 RepID=UPI000830D75B|nr:hypothetical protein [Nocardioides jensenii]
MTPDHYACVKNSCAAERAGDAAEALEWHQAVPMFRRGRNRHLMEQLVALGDALPEWVWARWIAYQAMRCEDGETGERVSTVRAAVTEAVHCDLLDACHTDGGDPVQVLARVMGESWAFQQFVVHEGGALVSFIDEFANGRLAEHAELARSWSGARMGRYRIGASLPGARLQVREPTGEWIEVLDLGARSCAGPQGWVLGRLVPSGVDGLLMFDAPPLGVARSLAKQIADHDDAWLSRLAHAVTRGRVGSDQLVREDFELTTDVQELDLLRFGTTPGDLPRIMRQLRQGRDEISRAAFRILQRALDGHLAHEDHAYVAAAALNAHGFDDVRRKLARPGQGDTWAAWAGRTVEPARGRLLSLAEVGRAAA